MRIKLLGGLCLATLLGGAVPAHAQSIDYGSLESLFGEPVTTSATGLPQRAPDVPVTMEIITADDIRRSGAVDIPGALRSLSGVSVWDWTRTTSDVSIRGYNQGFSPRLLVLINGRQIYSDAYGNTVWQNVPVQLEEIRQIEVVKGPNSALFGFNAVSGVINIITYNPMYDDISSAGVKVGTDNYRQGHLIHTQKFGDKVGIRISGGSIKADEFDEPDGVAPYYDPTNHELSLDSVFQITEDSQLRFEATKTKSKATEYPFIYSPFNSKYDTNSVKTSYFADTGIGMVQANLYRNSQKIHAFGSTEATFKNDVTVAQIKDVFKIGADHTFRLQTEYRRNELDGNLLSDGAEIFYDVYSAGGMWNWQLRDDMTWTNAVRADHLRLGRDGPIVANPVLTSNDDFDETMTELSYNSGLVWSMTNKDTLRLMTARGIQAPSLLDFGLDLVSGPVIVLGNPDLDAGVVTNYEIGYDRKIDAIGGMLRSSLFYQKTTDLKGSGALITGAVSQTDNMGDTQIIGAELGLEGRFNDHWNWDLNYTLQKANDDLDVNQGVTTVPYNGEEATPTHTLNAHIGFTKDKWEADAYAQYVSGYDVLLSNGITYDPVEAGDHVSLAARVGYKLTDNVTVAISGQELNHADTRETSGPSRERQVFLSLTTSF